MTANTRNLGIKSSSINRYSCHAEQEETLSEIDSRWQNGEYTFDQAREKALSIPECNREIIMAVFASGTPKIASAARPQKTKKTRARSVKATTAQFNMGPRWAR